MLKLLPWTLEWQTGGPGKWAEADRDDWPKTIRDKGTNTLAITPAERDLICQERARVLVSYQGRAVGSDDASQASTPQALFTLRKSKVCAGIGLFLEQTLPLDNSKRCVLTQFDGDKDGAGACGYALKSDRAGRLLTPSPNRLHHLAHFINAGDVGADTCKLIFKEDDDDTGTVLVRANPEYSGADAALWADDELLVKYGNEYRWPSGAGALSLARLRL